MRLGVFLPNWVGDVVMATPALRCSRSMVGPSGQLVGILRPYVAEVLVGTPWLDEQIYCERPEDASRALEWQRDSRLAGCEVGLRHIADQFLADRMARLAERGRTALGYRRDGRSWMLTKSIPERCQANGKPEPTLDGYRHLVEAAGCDVDSTQLELATTAADEQATDEVWKRSFHPAIALSF